jgi:C-terminal processing protease CtpA/Prc
LADRAQLVGEQTFGKGVVQYYFPINNDGGVKLTVAKYLTPHRCEDLIFGDTPVLS